MNTSVGGARSATTDAVDIARTRPPAARDLNRVNLALSHARLMVIVVAHGDSGFPPVGALDHLRLASRFAAAL